MRILYLMHVKWSWIRQRPHVLAEGLHANHDVRLIYIGGYRESNNSKEPAPPFPMYHIKQIPGSIRNLCGLFSMIDAVFFRFQTWFIIKIFKPNLVWVTHPVFEHVVPDLGKTLIVYDCMDDCIEFKRANVEATMERERRLVARAELTLFSSQTLLEHVCKRFKVGFHKVVNNGFEEKWLRREIVQRKREGQDKEFVLGYFGTMGSWFDWNLVSRLLKDIPSLHFHLAGPCGTHLIKNDRIKYFGVIRHDDLGDFVQECDALIMPFIVNRLIEAVDPVKLYEYVAFGLPSIAPYYSETRRFVPFVNLYKNHDQAVEAVREIIASPRLHCDENKRRQFLEANTWDVRCREIESLIQIISK